MSEAGVEPRATCEAPDASRAFRWAASRYPSEAPRFLALLLGWACVWIVVERLVVALESAPGGPPWLLLHAAYFWGSAYWEGAILRAAIRADATSEQFPSRTFPDHGTALELLLLKLLLIPVAILGLALFLLPGLYCLARSGPAFFLVASGEAGPRRALLLSISATKDHPWRLTWITHLLMLFNVFGAAFLGIGLFVTIPVSVLMCPHLFAQLTSGRFPKERESSSWRFEKGSG